MNPNHQLFGAGPNLNLLDNVLLAAGFQATDQPIATRTGLLPHYATTTQGEVRLLQSGGGYLQTSQHQQHHAANRLLQQQVSPPALVHNHHQAVTPTSVSNNAGVHVIVYQQEGENDRPISYKIQGAPSSQAAVVTTQPQQVVVHSGQSRHLVDEQGRQLVDEHGRQLIVDEHGRQLVIDEHGRQLLVGQGRQLLQNIQAEAVPASTHYTSVPVSTYTSGSAVQDLTRKVKEKKKIEQMEVQSLLERRKDIVAQAMQAQKISQDDFPELNTHNIMTTSAFTPITTSTKQSMNEQATTSMKAVPKIEPGVTPPAKPAVAPTNNGSTAVVANNTPDVKPTGLTVTPVSSSSTNAEAKSTSVNSTPTKTTPTTVQQRKPYERIGSSNVGRKPKEFTPSVKLLEDEDDGLTCRLCLASFWYKDNLHSHMKSSHNITDPEAYEKEEKERKLRKIQEAKEAELKKRQEAMALVAKKQREEREKKIREQMAAEAKKKGLNKSPAVRGAARPGGPQRPGGQPGAVGLRPSFQYNDGVFVCDICKKSFKAGFEMVTHWKTHIKAAHGAAAAGRGRGVLAGRGGRGGLAGGRGKGKGAVEVVDLDAEPKKPVKPILLKISKKSTEDAGSSDEEGVWEPEPFIEEESDFEPEEVVNTQAKKGKNNKLPDDSKQTRSGRKVRLPAAFFQDSDDDQFPEVGERDDNFEPPKSKKQKERERRWEERNKEQPVVQNIKSRSGREIKKTKFLEVGDDYESEYLKNTQPVPNQKSKKRKAISWDSEDDIVQIPSSKHKKSSNQSSSKNGANMYQSKIVFSSNLKIFLCTVCYKTFDAQKKLNKHIKNTNHTRSPGVKVRECDELYNMQFLRVYLDRISDDYEDNIEDLIAASNRRREQAKNARKNARRRAARKKNTPFKKSSKSKSKKKKKAPKYNVQVQVIDIDEQLDAEGEGDMDAEIVIDESVVDLDPELTKSLKPLSVDVAKLSDTTVQDKLPDENDPESSFDQTDHEKSMDDGETVIKNEHDSSVDEKDHEKSTDQQNDDHNESVDEKDHNESVDEKDHDESVDDKDQDKSMDENDETTEQNNQMKPSNVFIKPPFVDETTAEDLLDDLKSKVDDLKDLELDGEGEGDGVLNDDDSLDNIPTEDLLKSKDDSSDPFDKLL